EDDADAAEGLGASRRVDFGEAGRAARHLSSRVAGGGAGRALVEGVGHDAESRLPGAATDAKKKTLIAVEQDREDVIEARQQWAAEQPTLDPDRIVFIDETWAKTNMTRTYGRSQRGTRLRAKVPSARWETTTFLGAMRSTGFVAPLCIEGAVNGDLFSGWVEQHLAPTLRPGDVVVMDNLSSHKMRRVVQAIERVGAE